MLAVPSEGNSPGGVHCGPTSASERACGEDVVGVADDRDFDRGQRQRQQVGNGHARQGH